MSESTSSPGAPQPVSRRRVLLTGAAGAIGASVLGGATAWASPPRRRAPVRGAFTLGVASGDPLPDGVVLWTRLAPDPLAGDGGMPDRPVPVQWQVATDESFRRVVARGTELARPELAHSVHAEVRGLRPGAKYFYRFKAGPELSPVGRTKTAPDPRRRLDQLAFAFTSCQSYANGFYTAHGHLADEDLDLVVQLGDYIYEGGPSPSQPRQHDGDGEPITLDEYRSRHAQYKTDADLQDAHGAFPWVVVFDDHEVDKQLGRRGAPGPGAAVAGGVPGSPRGRVPGLLRAHAAAPGFAAARHRHPALPQAHRRRPCRLPRAGHPPVPQRPGGRRPKGRAVAHHPR